MLAVLLSGRSRSLSKSVAERSCDSFAGAAYVLLSTNMCAEIDAATLFTNILVLLSVDTT